MKAYLYFSLLTLILMPFKIVNADSTPRSLDIVTYMHIVTESFDKSSKNISETMELIESEYSGDSALHLQLLALRRYLRKGDRKVAANWSWKDSEITGKKKEEPAKTLYAEAKKAQKAFADANPGYKIIVTPIRSLERQVKLWNKNRTVQTAGKKLLKDMVEEISKDKYEGKTDSEAAAMFGRKLKSMRVSPEPTSAAPGTSNHGRGTAVDFVVKKGSKVVAGIKSSHIKPKWERDGWGKKLIEACSDTKLKGPLKTPNEPWHWELK